MKFVGDFSILEKRGWHYKCRSDGSSRYRLEADNGYDYYAIIYEQDSYAGDERECELLDEVEDCNALKAVKEINELIKLGLIEDWQDEWELD